MVWVLSYELDNKIILKKINELLYSLMIKSGFFFPVIIFYGRVVKIIIIISIMYMSCKQTSVTVLNLKKLFYPFGKTILAFPKGDRLYPVIT